MTTDMASAITSKKESLLIRRGGGGKERNILQQLRKISSDLPCFDIRKGRFLKALKGEGGSLKPLGDWGKNASWRGLRTSSPREKRKRKQKDY